MSRKEPRTRSRALEEIAVASLRTKAGRVYVLCSERGLREVRLGEPERPSRNEARARCVSFVRRPRWTDATVRAIEEYVRGRAIPADLPLDLAGGTPFQRRVWEATRRIPWGSVASYAAIATSSGSPRAVRAVGNALGRNPIPIVIPCHRVIYFDRSLGGFSSGLTWKRFLLQVEHGQLELTWRPRRVLRLFR